MLSKRVLVSIACLVAVAGLGDAAIDVAPALAETVAPSADLPELEKLRLAAGQGDAEAQFNLGMAYVKGSGVALSDGEAYFWLSLAASERAESIEDRDLAGSHLSSTEIANVQARVAAWKAKK